MSIIIDLFELVFICLLLEKVQERFSRFWTAEKLYYTLDINGDKIEEKLRDFTKISISLIQSVGSDWKVFVKVSNILNLKRNEYFTQKGVYAHMGFSFNSNL